MKIHSYRFVVRALILSTCLLALSLTRASADLPTVLTIDLSDPTNAVFTATLALSSTTDTSTTSIDGIDLISFFTANPPFPGDFAPDGTLQPFAGGDVFSFWNPDNYFGGDSTDLNLYSTGGNQQLFSESFQALSGTITLNLSDNAIALPGLGATGLILPGYSGGQGGGQPIGTWEVVAVAAVPEPSSFALGVMALVGLGLMVLTRRVAACS